jgi:hypothetical protein
MLEHNWHKIYSFTVTVPVLNFLLENSKIFYEITYQHIFISLLFILEFLVKSEVDSIF